MKNKVNNLHKAYFLVLLQFSSLLVILFTAPIFAERLFLLFIQIVGIFIGVWAVLVMKIGNFNISPVPVKNGELRISGPYKYVRHPMYSSLLLFAIPVLISHFTYLRFFMFLILIITLYFKINFEERSLIIQYPSYKNYQLATKRIIPFFY